MHSNAARVIVNAVPVPISPSNGGTTTNSEEAGVRQLNVSRVPPRTPIDLVRGRGPAPVCVGAIVGVGGIAVPVITVPPPRVSYVWPRSSGPVPLVSYLWLGRVPFPLGAVGRRTAHAVSV